MCDCTQVHVELEHHLYSYCLMENCSTAGICVMVTVVAVAAVVAVVAVYLHHTE